MVTAMTADGETIAFAEFGEASLAVGCYLRSSRGGAAVRLGDGGPLALSDDGRRVAALLDGVPARVRIYTTAAAGERAVDLGPIVQVGWATWRGDELIVGGAARDRPPRIWRLAPGAAAGADHRRGRRRARPGQPRRLPARAGHPRWPAAGDRDRDRPYRRRPRPAWSTTTSAAGTTPARGDRPRHDRTDRGAPARARDRRAHPLQTIVPPPLGRKGVDAVVTSATGDAYAYSYGQELSRLYVMTP